MPRNTHMLPCLIPMPSVTPGIFIHSHDALLLYIFQAYNKNVLSYAHCYLYSLLYLNTRPRKANCDSKKNFLATICISKNVKKKFRSLFKKNVFVWQQHFFFQIEFKTRKLSEWYELLFYKVPAFPHYWWHGRWGVSYKYFFLNSVLPIYISQKYT